MGKILLTIAFVLTTTVLFAQHNWQDVVHLRHGNVIRGTIIEQVPNESLTIETAEGSRFVIPIDDVARIRRARVHDTPVTFGFIGGLNVARQFVTDGQESGTTDARIGSHFGVFAEFPIGNNLTFRPELLYSMQGGKYYEDGKIYTDQLDYIILPLIFRWHFADQRMSLDIGPQFGSMIRAREVSDGASVSILDRSGLNRPDLSLVLGLSFNLNDRFSIGVRSTAGITNFAELDGKRYSNRVNKVNLAVRL